MKKKNKNKDGDKKSNKDSIIDTAFVLSLKKGFDNVSIKLIQDETGLAAGSIYYHFKDKNDILRSILMKHLFVNFLNFKKQVESFEGTVIERLRFAFLFKAHSFVCIEGSPVYEGELFSYKEFFTFLVSIIHAHPEARPLFYQLYDGLFVFLKEVFQEAMDNDEIRDDLDVESVVIYFQTLFEGYINLWIVKPNYPFEKIMDINLQYFYNSIKK